MANYDGVHAQEYTARGVKYVRLWWYIDQGSSRDTVSLGRRSKLTKTVINQHRKQKEKELALSPGRIGAGDAPTWGAWKKQYKAFRSDLADSSLKLIKQSCDYFAIWLKDKKIGDSTRIDQITRSDVAVFRKWLENQKAGDDVIKPLTVVKHMRNLSCMFGPNHGALKLDIVPFNPFDREKLAAKAKKKGHPDFTPEQIESLLDACPTTGWRSLVALCLYAGIRVGEGFELEWSDVAWGQGKLTICRGAVASTKKRERECKLEPELEKILLEGFEAGDANPVPVTRFNLNRNMKIIIKHAGLDLWVDPFHALRRWRDSTWKLTQPGFAVDEWLGHSAEVSREHYLSVPDHLYRPPERLDRIKGLISQLDDKSLDRIEKIANHLLSRIHSAQHRRNIDKSGVE